MVAAQEQSLPALPEPLARYVPIEAGFYLRLSNRDGWLKTLGLQDRSAVSGAVQWALPEFMSGLDHLVIAASSWREHRQAVIICKPEDPDAIARSLGLARMEPRQTLGGVRQFELPDRTWVATDGQVFVFSEFGPETALFGCTVRLLNGQSSSLLEEKSFRSFLGRVRGSNDGLVFIAEDWKTRQGSGDAADPLRPRWLPDLQYGGVELFLQPGRVVCQLLAVRRQPQLPLPNAVYPAQLQMLPATTLVAWTQLVDVAAFIGRLPDYVSRNDSPLHWHLVQALQDADLNGELALREVGPRTTLCLLAGGERGASPRLGLIIEAAHAEALAETLAEIIHNVAEFSRIRQGLQDPPITCRTETFQGHVIREFLPSGPAESAALPNGLRPAICAAGQQIILATQASVVQDMLTARAAGEYTRPSFRNWVEMSARGGDDSQIRMFVDLQRLAPHLDEWRKFHADDARLQASAWFQELRRYWDDAPVQLGARLRNDQPGKVYVVRVLDDRPAWWARLKPEDLIIGIDGQLLSLEDAKAELRSHLTGGRHRLRVERHGEIVELTVDLPPLTGKSLRGLLDDTAIALAQVAALGAYVGTVDYRQYGTDPAALQAELVFSMRPAAPAP
jgi:hypothetical protein